MAIINYYEKYGVSKTEELEKIQWVISQKITDEENDSFGEGHSDKMFILQLAKEVFATAESRAKYDQELADSLKKSDPDGERKAKFEKWYGDAKKYYETKQYDLAKSAIERASQFKTAESEDSQFYMYAALIYSFVDSYSQALDYANQAIVLAPEFYEGYRIKADILERYLLSNKVSIQPLDRSDLEKQLLNALHLMCDKAMKASVLDQACIGFGWLAFLHYNWSGCKDQIKAEEYALRSVSYGKNTDAEKILNDIASRRAKAAELKSVNHDLQSKLERDNAKYKKEISDLKSSINNATDYGNIGFNMEFWVMIVSAAIGLICLLAGAGGAAILFIFIAIAILSIRLGLDAKNKNIRDTLKQISSKESEMNNNRSSLERKIYDNYREIETQESGLAPHKM